MESAAITTPITTEATAPATAPEAMPLIMVAKFKPKCAASLAMNAVESPVSAVTTAVDAAAEAPTIPAVSPAATAAVAALPKRTIAGMVLARFACSPGTLSESNPSSLIWRYVPQVVKCASEGCGGMNSKSDDSGLRGVLQ